MATTPTTEGVTMTERARPSNYPYAYGWVAQATKGAVRELTRYVDMLEDPDRALGDDWVIEKIRGEIAKLAEAEAGAIRGAAEEDARIKEVEAAA